MADLVSAEEVEDFPGAPFAADVLTAAGETVRGLCGWRIAPSEEQTVVLDSDGGCVLYVDTRMLTELAQVRDVTGTAPVVLDGVKHYESGRLYRPAGFPCGAQAVEVTFTDGYETCPADLVPVVADIARSSTRSTSVAQKSLGSGAITYSSTVDPVEAAAETLGRYEIVDL